MINNFDTIDKFLNFEEGYFYKFEALIRNTDGESDLCPDNKSNLIKSWYIDNEGYYNSCKKEMIELCNLTGARLYVTLDRKENKKLVIKMFTIIGNIMKNYIYGSIPSLKTIVKMINSCSSFIEVSEHKSRTIMFDIDIKNNILIDSLAKYIQKNGQKPYVLKTKKGCHLFCYKKFDSSNWEQDSLQLFYEIYKPQIKLVDLENLTKLLRENVTMRSNQLGLVYMGRENNNE